MSTIAKTCALWANGIASGEGDGYKHYSRCNVYYNGRTIYSYGSHFPMAYIVAPNLVWVNGDTFSNSTGRHQRYLRSAIPSSATVVIVPNTALTAAGLDYQTIVPVDVKPERYEYTPHTSDVAPYGMSTDLTERVEYRESVSHYYVCDDDGTECQQCLGRSHATYHETEKTTVYPAHDEPLHMSYGTVDSYIRQAFYDDVVGYIDTENGRQAVKYVAGQYHWHTSRHWLGDAVFTAVVDRTFDGTVGPRNYYVSSFDRQERRPLYFLSQLPHAVSTVDEAIESLSPDSVKTARDMGRNVVRQGDMFAIPMSVTRHELTKLGATFTKRKVSIEPNRYARDQIAKRDAVNALIRDMPPYPTRQYWLGHVQQSRDDFYLVYEDWQRACDAWSDALIARYTERFPDLEQITRWSWQSASKYKPSSWHMTRNSEASALYGTAHTASEVATLPDGRQFAHGVMYHDPAIIGQTRNGDHRRQRLGNGKQWHLVARNTVPVTGTGRGRR
jgi:hypothetical protein